jgi:hypothetical protein
LRPFAIAAALHELYDSAHVFGADLPLMPKHLTKLLENAIGPLDLFFRALKLKRVATRNQTDAQRITNRAQMLIPAAKKQKRLVTAVQGQRQGCCRTAHGVNPK